MADSRPRDTRFPETVRLVAPAGMSAALDELAGRQHTTRSELVRQTLLVALTTAGVSLPERTS
jgi:hypothetical protein